MRSKDQTHNPSPPPTPLSFRCYYLNMALTHKGQKDTNYELSEHLNNKLLYGFNEQHMQHFMKIDCEILLHHFAWKLMLTNLAKSDSHKNCVVNEFYKISWIIETIADWKFKVVSKNKYFRRKYRLTNNTYRKWCF